MVHSKDIFLVTCGKSHTLTVSRGQFSLMFSFSRTLRIRRPTNRTPHPPSLSHIHPLFSSRAGGAPPAAPLPRRRAAVRARAPACGPTLPLSRPRASSVSPCWSCSGHHSPAKDERAALAAMRAAAPARGPAADPHGMGEPRRPPLPRRPRSSGWQPWWVAPEVEEQQRLWRAPSGYVATNI